MEEGADAGEKRTMHSHLSGVLLYYVTGATIGIAMDRIGRSGERFSFGRQRLKKRKRPGLPLESWDARRTALPRSLLTTSLRSYCHCRNGSNVLLASVTVPAAEKGQF
jgi:hypothetical protein